MSLLIVGSVAFDTVETPFGKQEHVIGGSAMYASVAASFFCKVNIVGAVGSDFPKEEIEFLKQRSIDTTGLVVEKGKTFAWEGKYGYDLNEAHTLKTELNVFEHFAPTIPETFRTSEYVMLANIDPSLQTNIMQQMHKPKFVALDTMNHWITDKRDALIAAIAHTDIVIINEGEARQLAQEHTIVKAARTILGYGTRYLVVKRGEYGVLLFDGERVFSFPALPLEIVKDPTGAGDSFAGGFMGYLAQCDTVDAIHLRKAVVFGSVMASINVEDFSLNRFKSIGQKDISARLKAFQSLIHVEEIQKL